MKRPLVYFAVSLLLGCFSSFLFLYNFILGAVLAASFLAIMLFTLNRYYILQVTAFFILGILSVFLYFNNNIHSNELNGVRIVEENQYYTIGSYNNRKVILDGSFKNVKVGRRLVVKGHFKEENNYSKGIIGTFYVNQYKTKQDDLITRMYNFKYKLYDDFSKHMSKENTAFIMAICYGDTDYISNEQKNDFQKLGVIHAVSVSGFHIAIIYYAIEKVFGTYISMCISLLYVIFTGSKAPTVRAFLMIFLIKFSKKINKSYDSLSSVALSAMLILIIKPFYVLDIGFNLSYLCTLSIILFSKRVSRKLSFLPEKLNKEISMSISSQILSLPYASFCIKNISTGFMLGNIFLLPLYSSIVILGNIAVLFTQFNNIFNLLCKIINAVMISINGATTFLLKFCPGIIFFTELDSLILSFYLIAVFFAFKGKKKAVFIPVALSAVLLFQSNNPFPEIIYFNYGKSDSVVIKYKKSAVLITEEMGSGRIKNMKKEFNTTSVISAKDGSNKFILGKNYKVYVNSPQYYKDKNKTMQVQICSENKLLIFQRQKEMQVSSMYNKKNYDIIVVPENIKPEPLDFYATNTYRYIIVFGRAIRY